MEAWEQPQPARLRRGSEKPRQQQAQQQQSSSNLKQCHPQPDCRQSSTFAHFSALSMLSTGVSVCAAARAGWKSTVSPLGSALPLPGAAPLLLDWRRRAAGVAVTLPPLAAAAAAPLLVLAGEALMCRGLAASGAGYRFSISRSSVSSATGGAGDGGGAGGVGRRQAATPVQLASSSATALCLIPLASRQSTEPSPLPASATSAPAARKPSECRKFTTALKLFMSCSPGCDVSSIAPGP